MQHFGKGCDVKTINAFTESEDQFLKIDIGYKIFLKLFNNKI